MNEETEIVLNCFQQPHHQSFAGLSDQSNFWLEQKILDKVIFAWNRKQQKKISAWNRKQQKIKRPGPLTVEVLTRYKQKVTGVHHHRHYYHLHCFVIVFVVSIYIIVILVIIDMLVIIIIFMIVSVMIFQKQPQYAQMFFFWQCCVPCFPS